MKKYITLFIIFVSCFSHAEINKWKDDKGIWHFSNKAISSQTAKINSSEDTKKPAKETSTSKNKPLLKSVAHGFYYLYVGNAPQGSKKVVVINHGMFGANKTEFIAAQEMLQPWLAMADQLGLVLIAPVFNNEAFAVTVNGGGNGGYRGLFGRDINADDYIHEIMADYKSSTTHYDGRFYLVGHSAGAQFSNRYMVRHPERVIAAAYSAPAWFALPNPRLHWPFGMGARKYEEKWSGRTINKLIDISPNAFNWVKAAQIPTAIVVGENDLDKMRHKAEVGGDNHVERAVFWVKSMNELADKNGVKSQQTLILVPDVGHEYKKLAPLLKNHIYQFL